MQSHIVIHTFSTHQQLLFHLFCVPHLLMTMSRHLLLNTSMTTKATKSRNVNIKVDGSNKSSVISSMIGNHAGKKNKSIKNVEDISFVWPILHR